MKCGTVTCAEDATRYVLWPGQHLPMCEACGHRAIGVADAMGFQLMSTTLDALERELATKALRAFRTAPVKGKAR
jgi:hypothetical protein